MIKKINTLIMFLILITYLTGCGGGGGSSPDGGGEIVTNVGILTLLDNYKKAVEDYDVDGMLDCLDDSSGFSLIINEGSYTETKNYATLEEELDADEVNQLEWRKTTAEGGHNYNLELKLFTATSNNATSSGATVKQSFEVWESSDEITPAIKTDSGNIVWTLAQINGEWMATAMVINYNTTTRASLAKSVAIATISQDKGFGFGKIGLNF